MDACSRYLAIYNDLKRKHLDRVPTNVQYIKEDFIDKNGENLLKDFKSKLFNNDYFDIPLILGFDSVFAPFPSSFHVKSIKITTQKGEEIKIGANGEKIKKRTSYYEGGYIHNLEILQGLWANLKKVDRSKQIKRSIEFYENIAPSIFPVLIVDGIFDKVWRSMGMSQFSYNFKKNTKLYRELIRFYAELLKINIEGLIEATGNRGKVITILDDTAYKGRPMIPPERWNQDFLPHYKEINSLIIDTGIIPQIHSDGDPTELIPSFQKANFRGLQGWEGGARPNLINEKFPDFVVIGFADVSSILPYGKKKEIEHHVKQLMDAFKENRHFIIGPSTVIFKEISLENVLIFMKAVYKYGNY